MRRLTTATVAITSVLALSACSTPWSSMPMAYDSSTGSWSAYSSGGGSSTASVAVPGTTDQVKVTAADSGAIPLGTVAVDQASTAIIRNGDMSLDPQIGRAHV